ncbi:MAG: DUF6992 family protein [Thermaurantimonas sp.]
MLILGGWALGNIGVGIAGMNATTGNAYYFHQMNMAWNVVNFGIATAGYFFTKPQTSATNTSVANALIDLENTLMLNTGLDLAYITAGLALVELSKNSAYISPERFRGFGTSLILQGAFLGVFDLYQYIVFHKKRKVFLESRFSLLQFEPSINGLVIRF